MPTTSLLLKSTDITIANYSNPNPEILPKVKSILYTQDKSYAVQILYHPNTNSISRITQYKIVANKYWTIHGIDALFREDTTLISQISYRLNKKNGTQVYLNRQGQIIYKKVFMANKKISYTQYRYYKLKLLSKTKYINQKSVSYTQYLYNRFTLLSKTKFINGKPLFKIQYHSHSTLKTNYRSDGTPAYTRKYLRDGVTTESITIYQKNGSIDKILYYLPNGTTFSIAQYQGDSIKSFEVFYQTYQKNTDNTHLPVHNKVRSTTTNYLADENSILTQITFPSHGNNLTSKKKI